MLSLIKSLGTQSLGWTTIGTLSISLGSVGISLPFKIAGRSLDPSDLRMRLDVSVRDNKTIIRKIIENQNQYTAGQTAVTIQFSGDYNLTKQ